ncbi:MAG: pyridoxamine 5'-phosphate oxidase family protein [Cyclobacteriaceae bacterium]|nr:pyridoxamine 5'-phosphate oxidase family protein [Cyclobacteriaceae bacterium]
MQKSNRSKVKRVPKRAHYDEATINAILDAGQICHVGFIHHGKPVVIPTIYGRSGNVLYIHGATVSRLITELSKGIDIALSVAHVDGLVLARSAFHHSMNYRSVVLFGTATLVDFHEKSMALKAISDHLIPGRWGEVREPNDKELKATSVLKITIDEGSAKVRTGDPVDDEEDYDLDIWAGVLPFKVVRETPVPDKKLRAGIPMAESVKKFLGE